MLLARDATAPTSNARLATAWLGSMLALMASSSSRPGGESWGRRAEAERGAARHVTLTAPIARHARAIPVLGRSATTLRPIWRLADSR